MERRGQHAGSTTLEVPEHARTSGTSVGMKMPTPIQAKLLKKPNVMLENSSMGMNMVERASAQGQCEADGYGGDDESDDDGA